VEMRKQNKIKQQNKMKKSKNALLKTGKYLRETSVIVLGVAIT